MADLPYNYTIRIQSNGSSNPPASPSNQWQRRLNGQPNFVDIAGKTGTTYITEKSDQNAEIRLKQTFSGSPAYSNALKVTNATPAGSWTYKGSLMSSGTSSIGYLADDKSMYVAGRDGAGKKSTDGGNTWSNYSHGIQVPIAVFPSSPGKVLYGGYGGQRADDNVYYKDGNSGSQLGGFPSKVYVYGAAQLGSDLVATDIEGNFWVAHSTSGPFTKGSKVDSNGITIVGYKDPDGYALGRGYRSVWKIKSATSGTTVDYDKAVLPFNTSTSNGSTSNIAYDGKGNWLCGGSDAQVFRSYDFKNWTLSTDLRSKIPYNVNITGAAYVGGKWWVTGGYTGTLYLLSSTDGASWTKEPLPSGLSGWSNPKMFGFGDIGLWTFDASSSPYSTYYCIFE